jgi:hypothetical protein
LGDRNAIFLLALILIASPVAAQRTAIKPPANAAVVNVSISPSTIDQP